MLLKIFICEVVAPALDQRGRVPLVSLAACRRVGSGDSRQPIVLAEGARAT